MKPVSLYEIVADEGEYPYRKGGNLIWKSAVSLVQSRLCTLGVRVISSAFYRFFAEFRRGGLRLLPRCRTAGISKCV